jgi:hypothetical protein
MKQSSVAFKRTMVMRKDITVDTVCEGCGTLTIDNTPIFGTMAPVKDVYIARSTERYASAKCQPTAGKKIRTRNLVPADRSVEFFKRKSFRALVVKVRVSSR